MKRGDVVLVAMSGDDGKPRPALVVQSDEMLRFGFSSVVVCPMTSHVSDRPRVRVTVEPDHVNGLTLRSEIMVEKLVGMSIDKVRRTIGHVSDATMRKVDRALFVVLGLGRTRS